MDRIHIRGGRPLRGKIPISGAKNAALPLMVAGLLSEAPLELTNVPDLADIVFMGELLRALGVRVDWTAGTSVGAGGTMRISAAGPIETFASYDTVRKMRASFLVSGPLLARFGHAKVSLPGGCAIGARPVDLHLKGLEALGVSITLSEGYVIAEAPGGLEGASFHFPFVSVGATENLLMAATLAKGRTVLANAAREPEITDLGECLIKMGARISGLGTSEIVIEGVDALDGASHSVLPDRIETGTYAIAAVMTGGDIELTGTNPNLLLALTAKLEETGAIVTAGQGAMRVTRRDPWSRATDIATEPYPGFPTDLQAQYMALMTVARGTAHIRETIFENRFMHVPELLRMGANIHVEGDTAMVHGVEQLKGAPVMATDLRASVSLVLAGLAAQGETIVNRVYHLDRGFEHIEMKLSAVGADIERVKA
jgi:UDP-N-acetylglucosamine 1-carboxyvinyltransferase